MLLDFNETDILGSNEKHITFFKVREWQFIMNLAVPLYQHIIEKPAWNILRL